MKFRGKLKKTKPDERTDPLLMLRIIRACVPHVYRQRYHGRHEQDRADAEELWKDLDELGYAKLWRDYPE